MEHQFCNNERLIVFVSHSSVEKPIARRIRDELESKGVKVWLDEAEIRVGDSIVNKISSGLDSSSVMCILVSKHSSGSPWVERELNSYLPRHVRGETVILPCRIDATPMPILLSDIKYADFSNSFDDGIKGIMRAVRVMEEIERIENDRRAEELRLNKVMSIRKYIRENCTMEEIEVLCRIRDRSRDIGGRPVKIFALGESIVKHLYEIKKFDTYWEDDVNGRIHFTGVGYEAFNDDFS